MADNDPARSRDPRQSASLEQSNARYSAVLESALDAIIIMDHQSTIIEFNRLGE